MRLDMKTRKALLIEAAQRYGRARKKAKGRLLDEFVALTGYNRCYAARALRHEVRRGDRPVARLFVAPGRGRKRLYNRQVYETLVKIWAILDFPCGKRLVANMEEIVAVMTRWKELRISARTRGLLLSLSASTADRFLASERKKLELKPRYRTRPGSLLKHKVPVLTFRDWDEACVGFIQTDLVGHDGGASFGEFCQSLSATDVATGWTELRAVRNKAQVWVFEALQDIRQALPFTLKGINSDSGTEFINDQLIRYCKANKITFTRCREYRKNDNCYVEQKNYTAVRQTVGYYRYDREAELELLNRIYTLWRLYANFFLPQMKLVEKIRDGSKLTKRYDRPRTPYARVLASNEVSRTVKQKLREQYLKLNPARLRMDIHALQGKLFKLVTTRNPRQASSNEGRHSTTYANV
jgi:hypothetical protein